MKVYKSAIAKTGKNAGKKVTWTSSLYNLRIEVGEYKGRPQIKLVGTELNEDTGKEYDNVVFLLDSIESFKEFDKLIADIRTAGKTLKPEEVKETAKDDAEYKEFLEWKKWKASKTSTPSPVVVVDEDDSLEDLTKKPLAKGKRNR